MKKILIFSLAYFPKHIGGAEVAIKEKTDRIKDIEFHMVTLRYDSTLPRVEQVGNVLVHRIGFTRKNATMADLKRFPLHYNKYWFQCVAAFKALSLHRAYEYSGTWAMMAHSCGVPAALFKLMRPSVPYVLELQEGDPPEYIERLMRPLWPLFSRAFTTANVVSVISTFLGNWARRRGFKGPVELVPNAVDTAHFSQKFASSEIEALRGKLGKRQGDTLLITTSRLVHKNAIDDVICALKLCPPSIKFVVAGIGPDEVALKATAEKLGVAERVLWLGQVAHADMPRLLKACDIFIRPSRSEGMGNSFLEAMAVGLPVIATQEGGLADFISEEVAWPVPKDNPEAIVAAVKDILASPEKVAQKTEKARSMVLGSYDWDKIAVQMRERVFSALV